MSPGLFKRSSLFLAACLIAGCGGSPAPSPQAAASASSAPQPEPTQLASTVPQPEGWNSGLALSEPKDLNPDPRILEINLEAKVTDLEIVPGHKTPVWTYNGSLPGPLIHVQVGDKIIVHFKNSLPEATSIHWHGMRLPNDMDGVPNVTQPPIPAGGEFTYEFVAPDAGTYWYHPHMDSSWQVGHGLYGPIIVDDPKDPKSLGDNLVLVLSDMSLDDDGQFLPRGDGGAFGDLFGREGNVLLVNGKVMPTLKVREGKPQRWRIINATRSRYYTMRLPHDPFTVIGSGGGLAERPQKVKQFEVVPAERQDVMFTPSDAPGTTTVLKWIPTDRGFGSTYNREQVPMFKIQTVADAPVKPDPIPGHLRNIEPIDITNAVQRRIELTIAKKSDDPNRQVIMGINGVPYWQVMPIEAHVGETDVWHVVNNTAFAHPFHLHGYFFQVLDDKRVPEWKDVVNVPEHSDLMIAMKFDDRPGYWAYHCHILDHSMSGMMGLIHVAGPGEPPVLPTAPFLHPRSEAPPMGSMGD
ncbi:MAG TPA: multicopper oxidase family protein [Gammaproteobacteria bacterium]|nr:multicopper oxidase family protein [Gammaproteobacteria bacterium]